MNERRRLAMGAAATAGAAILLPNSPMLWRSHRRRAGSRVAVLHCASYEAGRLEEELRRGLAPFRSIFHGKRVLLKPNLVEVGPHINTHPAVVGAAIDALLALGAALVVVGEGPGHHRDTQLVALDSGLDEQLRDRRTALLDLNRTPVVALPNRGGFSSLGDLYFPRDVVSAEVIVSMPKMKTHHWVGVTLAMKNMFGALPGSVYGWPKNVLHWQGIPNAILDICATVPPQLVIADGIVAMEGNGPLHGTPRPLGKIVISDDPVAADFTCCRLMGLVPERVPYLARATRFLGYGEESMIEQLAERVVPAEPFATVPEFAYLRLNGPNDLR